MTETQRFTDLPIHAFADAEAFAAWLSKHHDDVPAIALRFAKKGSGIPSLTYKEALDVVLAYGWIDAQSKSEGEATYLQRFGKRRPKSLWSKINCAHAERLLAEGKMHPAGLAEVERAKADGRWGQAYASPNAATVPDDLTRALAASPRARALFTRLGARNRYAVLHRIETAKRPETRARRIATLVLMLARGETPYPEPK